MKSFIEFLDEVTKIQGIHDEKSFEENFDSLYEIATPKDDPVAMGETFKSAIGYDPITYYDQKTANEMFDFIVSKCSDYPQSIHRLNAMKNTAVQVAMKQMESAKKNSLADSIWGFVKDNLDDVEELSYSQITKLGEEFMDAFGCKKSISSNPPKRKSLIDIPDIDTDSDLDEIEFDESNIDFGDE